MNMPKPGPSRRVEDDEIIEAIMRTPGPVASTSDIADRVNLSHAQLRTRLKSLENGGVVKSKAVGNSNAWWVATV